MIRRTVVDSALTTRSSPSCPDYADWADSIYRRPCENAVRRTYHQFDLVGQRRFAKLSGDHNPIHLDPVRARREMLGDVVVHGVHGALHALEVFSHHCSRQGVERLQLHRLEVEFREAIYLEGEVTTELIEDNEGHATLRMLSEGRKVTDLKLIWESDARPEARHVPAPISTEPTEPALLGFDDLNGRRGELQVFVDRALLAETFPILSKLVSARTIADILALSRLVGMECPGVRSIFWRFDVELHDVDAAPVISWRVSKIDDRFSLVSLELRSPTLAGEIEAFLRPEPQAQPSYAQVREVVDVEAFVGQSALIVGGSRGLGEVTAKIVAAGGGRVVVTYHRGRDDAELIAQEIRHGGGQCTTIPFDATSATAAQLHEAPSHLYYFASPKIFVKKRGPFDDALLQHFTDYYVDGFDATIRRCRKAGAEELVAFYPSSVAVDQHTRNLEEYAAAKTAGEALCADLDRSDDKLTLRVERLPRIATDQTTTLVPVSARDALEVMLPIVKAMRR